MTTKNPLVKLILYYAALAIVVAVPMWLFPSIGEYMPVGKAQALIAQADGATSANRLAAVRQALPHSFGASILWLISAAAGSLLTALPVSWVYMDIRATKHYDQSLVDTIVILPLIVTGIVIIVQNSLALSFSLAGIAGIARYRNTLKSPGDLLFILLSIAIGLAAGIGAVELALVMSAAFNLCFLALWATSYGERPDMERFLGEVEHHHGAHGDMVSATVSTAVVTKVTETFAPEHESPTR